jgi:hypothetical protein
LANNLKFTECNKSLFFFSLKILILLPLGLWHLGWLYHSPPLLLRLGLHVSNGYTIVILNVKCAAINTCDFPDTVGSVYVLFLFALAAVQSEQDKIWRLCETLLEHSRNHSNHWTMVRLVTTGISETLVGKVTLTPLVTLVTRANITMLVTTIIGGLSGRPV